MMQASSTEGHPLQSHTLSVFLRFSYKFHSLAFYSSRFWKYMYNPFIYLTKNKFIFIFHETLSINLIKVNEYYH